MPENFFFRHFYYYLFYVVTGLSKKGFLDEQLIGMA